MTHKRMAMGALMNQTELCNRLARTPEDRLLLRRVLDQAVAAERKCVPCRTHFLSPREAALSGQLIAALGQPSHRFDGGYPSAERQVCVFLPDWLEPEDCLPEEVGITALRATWYQGESLSHRDLLGALMGLGVRREMVGDLLAAEHSCDCLLLPEVVPFLLQNLTQAGRSRLRVAQIGLDEIVVPAVARKIIRDTVSSLRLDAVAASGFGTSRAKMAEAISSGRVTLNYLECTRPDHPVAQGDGIACRGMGKCRLTAVGGRSRKGRVNITLERYI